MPWSIEATYLLMPVLPRDRAKLARDGARRLADVGDELVACAAILADPLGCSGDADRAYGEAAPVLDRRASETTPSISSSRSIAQPRSRTSCSSRRSL